MRMPGFTAVASMYQSTRCYVMAPVVAFPRGDGVLSMAAAFMPFMPTGGNGGGGQCFPKGCGPCSTDGFRICQNQDWPDCTTRTEPCTPPPPTGCINQLGGSYPSPCGCLSICDPGSYPGSPGTCGSPFDLNVQGFDLGMKTICLSPPPC